MACSFYGILAALFLRLVPTSRFGNYRLTQHLVAVAYRHAMRLTTGVQFQIVSGAEHLLTRPCVIVSNHQSALDVSLIGAVMPPYCSITAKSSLRLIPILGWYMALSGTVFIDRGNRTGALKAFEKAAEEMRRQRQSVFIFPEGTRSYAREPTLGGFKKGAFHLAVKAGVDVVPVVAACYWGVLSSQEGRFRKGVIPVKGMFPPPFPFPFSIRQE